MPAGDGQAEADSLKLALGGPLGRNIPVWRQGGTAGRRERAPCLCWGSSWGWVGVLWAQRCPVFGGAESAGAAAARMRGGLVCCFVPARSAVQGFALHAADSLQKQSCSPRDEQTSLPPPPSLPASSWDWSGGRSAFGKSALLADAQSQLSQNTQPCPQKSLAALPGLSGRARGLQPRRCHRQTWLRAGGAEPSPVPWGGICGSKRHAGI